MTLMLFPDLFYKALKEFDYDGMEAKKISSAELILLCSAVQQINTITKNLPEIL